MNQVFMYSYYKYIYVQLVGKFESNLGKFEPDCGKFGSIMVNLNQLKFNIF